MLLWKRKGTWLALPGGRVKREAARPGVGCKSQLVVASEWAIRECASVPTHDAGEGMRSAIKVVGEGLSSLS